MNQNDIDNILATEGRIIPSPEFLASVMRAVEREAASLPPLQFPWIRALPGFLAAIVAITGGVRHGIGLMGDPAAIRMLNEQLGKVEAIAAGIDLQWILIAVAATIISLILSSSLVRGGIYVESGP